MKTHIALARCEQNLNQLFMIVHLFGHQDEGGLDEYMLETVRNIIELIQAEFETTLRLLSYAADLPEPPPEPTRSAEIKEFRKAG